MSLLSVCLIVLCLSWNSVCVTMSLNVSNEAEAENITIDCFYLPEDSSLTVSSIQRNQLLIYTCSDGVLSSPDRFLYANCTLEIPHGKLLVISLPDFNVSTCILNDTNRHELLTKLYHYIFSHNLTTPGSTDRTSSMSANTKASATELYTSTEDPLMATSTISNKPGTSRPAQTTSAASPPPPCSGDYYDVDDECDRVTERTTQGQKPSELSRCDYKPCTHLQRTCIDSRPQHCFCPGMTPGNVPPDPPTFVTAADVRGHAVVVTWCAPYSAVQEYWLQLQQETEPFRKNQSLSPISRQCVFSGLKTSSRYKACVTARNSAGSSSTTCVGFQTEVGPELYIYSLAALSGSLLLTACILSVCLWKQRRSKQPAVESAHLTGLISIPNPAFSCSEERQTSPSKIFKI